ncbi:MAG TPA: hypothetical protein VML55_01030 [Planctomycetaceae bacterium]|nr:hypothetical protein [Planctomycetaceae bacterium]
MSRLFVGNFEFERALGNARHTPRDSVRRTCAELASVWVGVAEDGDFVWTPEPIDERFFDELAAMGLPRVRAVLSASDVPATTRLCPWGWTDALREWAQRSGWTRHAPPQAAVRQVNSRRFSFELEGEWGVGLAGASLITRADELPAALQRLPAGCRRWVLKAEFGMAARERLLGTGRAVTDEAAHWLSRRLASGCVVLEPWIERLEEAGLQFEIPDRSDPRLVDVTPLLTDAAGVYRGSRFDPDPLLHRPWSAAIATCHRAAGRLQALGYFGPCGFDAVRYRDFDGAVATRPLQDINARWTMGRVALGFRRLLNRDEVGAWLHANWPGTSVGANQSWLEHVREHLPSEARLIPTTPLRVGAAPTKHGTLVLAARTRADLIAAVAVVGNAPEPQ